MILVRFVGVLSTLLIGLAVYLFFYLGVSKPVVVEVEQRGPFHLLFVNHRGAYHEIGPSISSVEEFAREKEIPCPKTFGEFLDDPNAVDQDRLRSHAGCVLEAAPKVPLKEGLEYELRPARWYAIGRFEGSPAIGPMKVYPKVREFIDSQRLKPAPGVLETYLIHGEKVTTDFLFPVDKP